MFRVDTSGSPEVGLDNSDLGKEREIRALRAKNAELERRLAEHVGRLVPAAAERLRLDAKHSRSNCGWHPQVLVSMETPEVTCAICDEPLSALDVLRSIAKHEMRFCYTVNDLQQQKRDLEKEVAALKKMRTNLTAQVRRVRKAPK